MKKIKYFISMSLLIVTFAACGTKEVKPDYTTNEAETALNKGEDLQEKLFNSQLINMYLMDH